MIQSMKIGQRVVITTEDRRYVGTLDNDAPNENVIVLDKPESEGMFWAHHERAVIHWAQVKTCRVSLRRVVSP